MPMRRLCLMVLGALTMIGCDSQRPLASSPGSAVAFTDAQAAQAREIMLDSAQGVRVKGPDLDLLPASGWRWSDLRQAITAGGSQGDLAVAVVSFDQSDARAFGTLKTVEGWPGTITVHKAADNAGSADNADNANRARSLEIEVRIGPYPDQPHARERAAALERAVYAQLLQMGKRPKLAPWPRPAS
ncbi:MAG: hypothetical protein MK101_07555 [Phycisphaerales bacterium]|nr:hypothetical protein [Phycisphaerales bacterium]